MSLTSHNKAILLTKVKTRDLYFGVIKHGFTWAFIKIFFTPYLNTAFFANCSH